jgi:excisionase family DNA binding protein
VDEESGEPGPEIELRYAAYQARYRRERRKPATIALMLQRQADQAAYLTARGLYTVQEAAALVGRTRRALYREIAEGRIPAEHEGIHVYISAATVAAYLKRGGPEERATAKQAVHRPRRQHIDTRGRYAERLENTTCTLPPTWVQLLNEAARTRKTTRAALMRGYIEAGLVADGILPEADRKATTPHRKKSGGTVMDDISP